MSESDNNNSPLPQAGEGPGVRAVSQEPKAESGKLPIASPRPRVGEGQGVRAASIRKRHNPYAQVALTYLRRPFSSVASWIVAIVVLLLLAITFINVGFIIYHPLRGMFAFQVLFPIAILYACLAAHIGGQFALPHADLTPRYLRVHATVAAGVVTTVVVFLPAVASLLAGTRSVGLTAMAVCFFGAALWYVLVRSRWFTVLCTIGWVLLCLRIEIGLPWVQPLIIGQYEWVAVPLLLIGGVMILLAGARLRWLGKDLPDRRPTMPSGWAPRSQMTGQASSGSQIEYPGREWFVERQMNSVTWHARRASSSRWSRVCRWQIAMTTDWLMLLASFGAALAIQLILSVDAKRGWTIGAVAGLVTYLCVFTSLIQLSRRTHTLAFELLLPVDRGAFLRQQGLAVAISHLRLWGTASVALFAGWFVLSRELAQVVELTRALFVAGCCQIWAFGIVALLGRGCFLPIAVAGAILAMGVPVLLIAACQTVLVEEHLCALLSAAALLNLFGVLSVWAAYRRWLATDIE